MSGKRPLAKARITGTRVLNKIAFYVRARFETYEHDDYRSRRPETFGSSYKVPHVERIVQHVGNIEVSIDLEAIVQRLYRAPILNKGGKATAMHGAIQLRALDRGKQIVAEYPTTWAEEEADNGNQ